ncbi:AMIN-like domain-containing (lipo)protein [Streptomyces sp. NPDC002536]
MRRVSTALAALLLTGAGLAATTGTAVAVDGATTVAGIEAACAGDWGSLPKVNTETAGYAPLVNIRTGQHACFDRMVFDIRGAEGSTEHGPVRYHVRYVDELHQDGSGDLIPVGGGAILEVRVGAPSYDPETMQPSYRAHVGKPLPGVGVEGYRTFKDIRYGGSFEGDTQVGVGVRARLPFRVFQSGNHVVVDVAHSWHAGAR